MTSIRNAILMAADHIESRPEVFNYYSMNIPGYPDDLDGDCGTTGCALGWISTFAGVRANSTGYDAAVYLMDLPFEPLIDDPTLDHHPVYAFYNRMDSLCYLNWRSSAKICAATLRLYADKYHPAEGELRRKAA